MKTKKKSEYSVQTFTGNEFETLEELVNELKLTLKVNSQEIGYVEPGHGLKGKNRWLNNNEDIAEMYVKYGKRTEITLWCQCTTVGNKRRCSIESEPKDSSKKSSIMKNIQEVEGILKELKKRHGPMLTCEQFNAWAHMINTEKHSSYDIPPNLPYFKKSRSSIGPSTSASPIRLNMRSECISQLDKWHSLFEKNCITKDQYDQLREAILKDVFNS